MNTGESKKFVGAVEAGVKILRRLADTDEAEGVASIARETGLNVSTTFNILKTLTKEGLVTFDDRTKSYRIGMGVLELALPVMGRSPSVLIRPLMETIAEKHQVSVALWNVTGGRRLVLSDHVEPSRVVHAVLRQGARLPDLAGAIGRCIAAHRGLDHAALRRDFDNVRWQNAPDFDVFLDDVRTAQATGYAFDLGHLYRGVNLVAAVACDREGQPRLGLSAISIAQQVEEDALSSVAVDLLEATRTVERGIFGRARRPADPD